MDNTCQEWPIFSKKELVIGNLNSQIGVCTLWFPREKFVQKKLQPVMDKVAVVGNLYSVYGIGIMIRNFLANTNLRYLLVAGTDLGKAREILSDIGKDSGLANKLSLEQCHIQRFLNQVKVIYTNDDEIQKVITDISSNGGSGEKRDFEPLIIPLPDPKTEIFPTSDSGHLIKAPTIREGYFSLLKEIRLFGHITGQDSEGHTRQELWQLTMVITSQNPCDFSSIPHPEYDEGHIEKYCTDFWNGTEPEDLEYRYGHIIRHGVGDQIKAVIKAFKEKEETFRTVISLWKPEVYGGSIVMKDPPCIILLHPRIIGKSLNLEAYIRTNDMFGGWPLNAAALRYFQYRLLEMIRIELKQPDIQLGDLSITSGSAHVYERDWVRIDAMLNEKPVERFRPDPKGNFEVRLENGEIVVRHFNPQGELLQIFKGTNAEKLSAEISPFISEIRNALYVGRELQRVETLLKKSSDC